MIILARLVQMQSGEVSVRGPKDQELKYHHSPENTAVLFHKYSYSLQNLALNTTHVNTIGLDSFGQN